MMYIHSLDAVRHFSIFGWFRNRSSHSKVCFRKHVIPRFLAFVGSMSTAQATKLFKSDKDAYIEALWFIPLSPCLILLKSNTFQVEPH